MRAIGYMNYGGPEVLRVYDLPEIHAGRGQVRLRNYVSFRQSCVGVFGGGGV
jgi:hypothetical protein